MADLVGYREWALPPVEPRPPEVFDRDDERWQHVHCLQRTMNLMRLPTL
jgi:hypothetical protein